MSIQTSKKHEGVSFLPGCKQFVLTPYSFDERAKLPPAKPKRTPAQMSENNIEKVVQQGDRLYFISKLSKDAPLESQCKIVPWPVLVNMPVPDRRQLINEDQIPNLKHLLMIRQPQAGSDHMMSLVDSIKQTLVERLKRNLMMHLPPVVSTKPGYHFGSGGIAVHQDWVAIKSHVLLMILSFQR